MKKYVIDFPDTLDTPALVIYKDLVTQNIDRLLQYLPDRERLRPHVKTHKSAEITHLLLQKGITKFKCSTIAEAEMLGMCGAPDVLLAYQPSHTKTFRVAQLIRQYPNTTFSCLVDNWVSAQIIHEVMVSINHCLPVYIDLNVGMDRTGILPENAVSLYFKISNLSGLLLMGLHLYDGHIRDIDFEKRKSRCLEGFQPVEEIKKHLISEGEDPILIAGGSPTFPIYAEFADIECSPGTFVYWDHGYQKLLPDLDFTPAVLVLSRIVSCPYPNVLSCDLGHKSIASENPLDNRINWLNAPDLVPIGHSEEHMMLKCDSDKEYPVGTLLFGVPYHICPTNSLYDLATVVTNGKIAEEWPIHARGRKIRV